MNNKLTVSVIIPNWNGWNILKKNLPAVIRAGKGSEIIVVDDASTDDSVAFLRKEFPEVTVVEKKKHEGFASTVNVGVTRAHGDIVVLLNSDTVPEVGFLSRLLPHFDRSDVFAVGCMDKSIENGTVIFRGRGIARWYRGFFIHARGEVNKSDTAWVSGGSGAFRKSFWDTLGGMDTLFNPFYWEDIDLSYRARKAGYTVVFEKNAVVEHRHEEGVIKRSFSNGKIKRIAYRNQFIFIWKNCSDMRILLSHILWTPIRLLQTFLSGDPWMFVGFSDAILRLPSIFNKRLKYRKLWKHTDCSLKVD